MLLNFRVDPKVISKILPDPFTPKLFQGSAIAGICLIRLEHIRPLGLPAALGFSSENAAHRIAVEWGETGARQEGVFIPRRDSNSVLNQLAGGRLFSGEHHPAKFQVSDSGDRITLHMAALDGRVSVHVSASAANALPGTSCFGSVAEASAFFEPGSLGYSVTRDPGRLNGVTLKTRRWRVAPLQVESVRSSFFSDESLFPRGAVVFDHALIMRDIEHEWHGNPDLCVSAR